MKFVIFLNLNFYGKFISYLLKLPEKIRSESTSEKAADDNSSNVDNNKGVGNGSAVGAGNGNSISTSDAADAALAQKVQDLEVSKD